MHLAEKQPIEDGPRVPGRAQVVVDELARVIMEQATVQQLALAHLWIMVP